MCIRDSPETVIRVNQPALARFSPDIAPLFANFRADDDVTARLYARGYRLRPELDVYKRQALTTGKRQHRPALDLSRLPELLSRIDGYKCQPVTRLAVMLNLLVFIRDVYKRQPLSVKSIPTTFSTPAPSKQV